MSNQHILEKYNFKESDNKGKKVLSICILLFLIIMIILIIKTYRYWWIILYIIVSLYVIELIVYITTNLSYYDMIHKDLIYGTIMDSNELSKYMYVPESKEYIERVKLGYDVARGNRLLILCLARDVEHNVEITRNKLENIGKDFMEYKIVIFENDSDDESRLLLKGWMNENDNVELMDCCDLGSCDCLLNNAKGYDMGPSSQGRMDKMRFYREKLLRYATGKYYYYDYVMVYDFDISGIVYKDGLMTCFSSENEWDMVCANGLQSFPKIVNPKLVIYDSLAFIPNHVNYNHSLSLIQLDREQMKLKKHKIGSELVRCKSGFNGIAIYRMEALLNSTYMNSKKYCEHIDLHQDMYNKGYDKIYLNPNMVLFVGQNGPDRSQIFKEFRNFFKKIDNN